MPEEGYPGHPETAGYGLRTETRAFSYDGSKVKGKLRIEYQDAGNRPELKVEITENYELPCAVQNALEDIFGRF